MSVVTVVQTNGDVAVVKAERIRVDPECLALIHNREIAREFDLNQIKEWMIEVPHESC